MPNLKIKNLLTLITAFFVIALVACSSDSKQSNGNNALDKSNYDSQALAICETSNIELQNLEGSSHDDHEDGEGGEHSEDLTEITTYFKDKKDIFDSLVTKFEVLNPEKSLQTDHKKIVAKLKERQSDFDSVIDQLESAQSEADLNQKDFASLNGYSEDDFEPSAKNLGIQNCITTFII